MQLQADAGLKSLSDSRFVVVGVVRNCAHCLEQEVERLRSAFSGVKRLDFLLIESDSSDQTVQVLRSLQRSTPGFTYLSLGRLAERHPVRTDRIAVCRNAYLHRLNTAHPYVDCDFVVVADLDGVNRLLTRQAVETCWSRTDWDVCTANQAGPYYDIWALRHGLWSPNDFEDVKQFLRAHRVSRYRAHVSAVLARMITLDPRQPWVRVDSAFGGLAIYKKEIIEPCLYRGLLGNGEPVCEHVPLNQEIAKRGGRIFINPAMINCGLVAHSRELTPLGHVVFWLRASLADCRDVLFGVFRLSR